VDEAALAVRRPTVAAFICAMDILLTPSVAAGLIPVPA
jgi:hypothetical protein